MKHKYFVGTVMLETMTNKKYVVEEVGFNGHPAHGKMFAIVKEIDPKESMEPRRINLPDKVLDENFKILSSPRRPAFAGTFCYDPKSRWGKESSGIVSHEGSSGEHYTGITAEYAGKLVEEDIKSTAEGNGYSCA